MSCRLGCSVANKLTRPELFGHHSSHEHIGVRTTRDSDRVAVVGLATSVILVPGPNQGHRTALNPEEKSFNLADMSSPQSDWNMAVAPGVPVILPLPTSSCSRLDNLTLRSVYSIITDPPPVWRGKLEYLAEMYDHSYNIRVAKFERERKNAEERWHINPLTPPQGVSAQEWNKRCLEADEREKNNYEEGSSDSTVTAETEMRPKQVKAARAKAKAKAKARKRLSP